MRIAPARLSERCATLASMLYARAMCKEARPMTMCFACRTLLLTRDLGFGKLTVLRQLPALGVVIIRLRGRGDWVARAPRVVAALKQLGDRAEGAISTIDWNATRTRPLPKAK